MKREINQSIDRHHHHGASLLSPGLLFRSGCVKTDTRGSLSASDITIQSLSSRARREEAARRERRRRKKGTGAMPAFPLSLASPFLLLSPLTPNPTSFSLPTPPFLRSQPLRLDIKVRRCIVERKREWRWSLLSLSSFAFFNASLSLALTNQIPSPSSPSLPSFLFQLADRSASPSGPTASRASICTLPSHGKG